jgi:hypothetical protein
MYIHNIYNIYICIEREREIERKREREREIALDRECAALCRRSKREALKRVREHSSIH